MVITAKERTEEIKIRASKSKERLQKEVVKEVCRSNWPYSRRMLYQLVHKTWFEAVCGCIILFNMVLVVFETDASVDDGEPSDWVGTMTNCLLAIYTTELVMKLYVYRKDFFFETFWNNLDLGIVGVDLLFLFISLVVNEMPSVSILRVFRLVRLARAFKAAKSFRELNSLLRACACAIKAIFWGMVLMALVLTVWGILSVQLIHPINKDIAKYKPYLYEGCERCPRAFSTVFDSVLTIWKQLVAGDSWGTLCEPIVEEASWTFLFFVLVLVSVSLTMLNCILAVVVEAGAAAAAADEHDKAVQREKLVLKAEGQLIDLCQGLDSDDSGELDIHEFLDGFHNNKAFRDCLEVMHVTESDMMMIFNICDEDDSGDVDYREFVEQLRRIKHSGEQMLLHYVTDIRHMVNKIRPECLKPPAKKDESLEVKLEEGQPVPLPPEVGTLLVGNGARDNGTEKFIESTQVDIKSLVIEKLERMFKINEDLITMMGDVAKQSKVQTGLLDTLVHGIQNGGAQRSTAYPLLDSRRIPLPSALQPARDGEACCAISGLAPSSGGSNTSVTQLPAVTRSPAALERDLPPLVTPVAIPTPLCHRCARVV